jgi:hypothetical protein
VARVSGTLNVLNSCVGARGRGCTLLKESSELVKIRV